MPERFRATLAERHLVVPLDATVLGLTNAFRAEAGLAEGDEVEVVIDRDDAPREGVRTPG